MWNYLKIIIEYSILLLMFVFCLHIQFWKIIFISSKKFNVVKILKTLFTNVNCNFTIINFYFFEYIKVN
jgi:hypothetical protein